MINKVIIADDHTLLIEGLAQSLKILNEQLCVIAAPSGKKLRSLLPDHQDVDLIILDLSLPDENGFLVLEFIKQLLPETPVIILSASDDVLDMRTAINNGARAYLTKTESIDVMLTAIQLVLAGGVYIPPALVQKSKASMNRHVDNRRPALTGRQRDVLRLLAEGLSNKEIGRQLHLSEATVKAHVSAILKILEVGNRTQAVNAAKRLSLVANSATGR